MDDLTDRRSRIVKVEEQVQSLVESGRYQDDVNAQFVALIQQMQHEINSLIEAVATLTAIVGTQVEGP